MNRDKWLLAGPIMILEDDFALEIGLVDVEGVSQRAGQARKLKQHSCQFCVKLFLKPQKCFPSEKIECEG